MPKLRKKVFSAIVASPMAAGTSWFMNVSSAKHNNGVQLIQGNNVAQSPVIEGSSNKPTSAMIEYVDPGFALRFTGEISIE